MIIPVQIYSSDLQSQFSMSSKDVEDMMSSIVGQLSRRLYTEWEGEAKLRLKSTRTEYIRSLKFFSEGPLKGGVMLTRWLPNALESGIDPFDEKVGMLSSPKAKQSKNGGRYLTIPLRHATSSSLGESSAFSGVMPASVEKAIKSSQVKKFTPPSPYDVTKTRLRIETPKGRVFEEYKHKHSIYEGMIRSKKTYEKSSSSQYMTFRRVSSKSDASSWIHPGFVAYNLSEAALNRMDIPEEIGAAIDEMLLKMGFE